VLYAAVLDTCILYPATLRDTLLCLAEAGLYRPLWTADILAELQRNLGVRRGPGSERERQVQVARLIGEMTRAFEDALVTGYEPLIEKMTNDPKDRHVLAAAVRGGAAAVVTFNLDDFPESSTGPLEIEAVSPDDFLLNQLDLDPTRVVAVLRRLVAGNRRAPTTLGDLCDSLGRHHAPGFAAELGRVIENSPNW
jgi:predicted nucleic acid-binding protein